MWASLRARGRVPRSVGRCGGAPIPRGPTGRDAARIDHGVSRFSWGVDNAARNPSSTRSNCGCAPPNGILALPARAPARPATAVAVPRDPHELLLFASTDFLSHSADWRAARPGARLAPEVRGRSPVNPRWLLTSVNGDSLDGGPRPSRGEAHAHDGDGTATGKILRPGLTCTRPQTRRTQAIGSPEP